MYDIIPHLARQVAFSRATFGPGPRTEGVIEHVQEELKEVQKVYGNPEGRIVIPSDWSTHTEAAEEWTDVVILGLDGLTRALWAANPSLTSEQVAEDAVSYIRAKQGKNEKRDWPDWRTADPSKPINHVRGTED